MSETVGVVVKGQPEVDPTDQEVEYESKGACYDRMSDADKAAVIKSVGSIEKIRANPIFNDC